jgi:GTP pyrophosphokinase
VFVFTPKGDVKSLPRGATPVDFAYTVHSAVGEHTVGAKVNGKIVPLRYHLKNGDTIEILTAPTAHPSKDWLTFVKTSRAQTRIRSFIRQAEHRRSLEIGKELAEHELRRFGLTLNRLTKGGELDKAAGALGYKKGDDLLAALGYGKVAPSQVIQQLVPPEKLAEAAAQEPASPSRLTEIFRKVARRPAGGVRISGIDDVLVRFGRCCNPVPGDDILGFITRGRGVTVHTRACDKVLSIDPERRVEVAWDTKASEVKRPVSIRVVTDDRPGVLAQISKTISEAGMNISQATCRTTGLGRAVNTFEMAVGELKQLRSIMRSIEAIDGVVSVERMFARERVPT